MNYFKQYFRIFGFILLISFFFFNISKSQDSGAALSPSPTLQGHLNAIAANYIELKDAFVNNNASQAAKEAAEFRTYLGEIQTSGVDASVERQWMNARLTLMEKLKSLSNSADIENQREVFTAITASVEELLKQYGHPQQVLYEQYCPMAFDGKGATWLNEKKEILNPYGGKKMLHCGKVVDTLKAGSE